MPDQQPHELQYSQRPTPLRSNHTDFIFKPRYRLASGLVVLGVGTFIAGVAYVLTHRDFFGISRDSGFAAVHIAAVALLCAGHLLGRWPAHAGVEPITIALVRWFAQVSLRLLVLLSFGYFVRGPVAATFACVGIMLAHDFIIVMERYRRGEML